MLPLNIQSEVDLDSSSYLLGESFTYAVDAEVSGTGTDAEHANDYKFDTSTQDSTGVPALTFDFQNAVEIDSLWFYAIGVSQYQLAYSNNNSSYTNVFSSNRTAHSSGYSHNIGFTPRTARYWRLSVVTKQAGVTTIGIYEVQLMKLLVEFPRNTTDRPIEFNRSRIEPSSDAYLNKNDNVSVAEGLSERGKNRFDLKWDYLSKTVRDQLETIWIGPPKKPVVTVFVEPNRYPDRLWRSRWQNDFGFSYTTPSKSSGFTGMIEFMEV